MTILELRQTIAELLSGLIGSYTLPNGTTRPALWVDGEHGVPKGWKVDGMEASIRQHPIRRSKPMVGMVGMRNAWEVKLSHYSPGSTQMDEATTRILRHFPDATLQDSQSINREYQYARFIIPDMTIASQYNRAV